MGGKVLEVISEVIAAIGKGLNAELGDSTYNAFFLLDANYKWGRPWTN